MKRSANLLPIPVPRKNIKLEENRGNSMRDNSVCTSGNIDQNNLKRFGLTSLFEKIYFFTGNVEKVIKWNNGLKTPTYFEVIASLVSVSDVPEHKRKILLLRDQKGPILQVTHYTQNMIQLKDFEIGTPLRCVGHMTGTNALTAVSVREATDDELRALKRYSYICDFAVSGLSNLEDIN